MLGWDYLWEHNLVFVFSPKLFQDGQGGAFISSKFTKPYTT